MSKSRIVMVVICTAILLGTVLALVFVPHGTRRPPDRPERISETFVAPDLSQSTPPPGVGFASPEDPIRVDPQLKNARLSAKGDLEITMLIRQFNMRENKRTGIEARFGHPWLQCDVQRLKVKDEKGEAVLYRFVDSAEARDAWTKMTAKSTSGHYFQVGAVVVEVYGGNSVIALATEQLEEKRSKYGGE